VAPGKPTQARARISFAQVSAQNRGANLGHRAMELLIDKLGKTRSNSEFLGNMSSL
jgi:transcription termination factor Rho